MDKKTADKLRKVIKEKKESGEMISNRVLIEPSTPVDAIKNRLCRVFVDYCLSQKGQKSAEEISKYLEIDKSQLSLIVNYHINKLSIDYLIKLLEKLAQEYEPARTTIQRMILSA